MNRLSPDRLNAIALEETRGEQGFGVIEGVEVTPAWNEYGGEDLRVRLIGAPIDDGRSYGKALIRATVRLRDRFLELGEERYPLISYGGI